MEIAKGIIRVHHQSLYYSEVGKGDPIVILLGWGLNIDSFDYDLLRSHSAFISTHRLVFIHLSNFYKSSLSDHSYDLSDYVTELSEALNNLNISQCQLVGYSAGGAIALHFAASYPYRTKRLVLINSAGTKPLYPGHKLLSRSQHYFANQHLHLDKNDISLLRSTFRQVYDYVPDLKLANVAIPTLIIWGKQDKTIDLLQVHRFLDQLDNAWLEVYPHLGRDALEQPLIVSRLIQFLEGKYETTVLS